MRSVGTFNVSSFAEVTTLANFCRAPFPVSDLWLSSTHFWTPSGLAARFKAFNVFRFRSKVGHRIATVVFDFRTSESLAGLIGI